MKSKKEIFEALNRYKLLYVQTKGVLKKHYLVKLELLEWVLSDTKKAKK